MLGVCRPFRLEKVSIRSPLRLAIRRAQPFSKEKLLRAAHVMGPTLVALAFAGAANVARAQGSISFSGAQTFMQTVQTFAEYAGAVICLIGLIFAGVSFMSGNFQARCHRAVWSHLRRRRAWMGSGLDLVVNRPECEVTMQPSQARRARSDQPGAQ